MADIQVTGAIAPKADLRVYFAPFTSEGWIAAIEQATADGVDVLLISWGQRESSWKETQMRAIDAKLKIAALGGMTIVVAAGDAGVTDGAADGQPHVSFPASSPWVLAVGGTSLQRSAGKVVAETAWNSGDGVATGGGVSDVFEQPAWQSGLPVPQRANGTAGRGIPDVAATAWDTMAAVRIGGHLTSIGGTSISAGIWAGLLALVNQGLGRNVGFLNPVLHTRIGPAGILRSIVKGDNSTKGVKGYQAAAGWNPVAGWGSPDGEKLIAWLRENA